MRKCRKERQEVFSCFLQGPGLQAPAEATSGQSWPFVHPSEHKPHPADDTGEKRHRLRFLGPGSPPKCAEVAFPPSASTHLHQFHLPPDLGSFLPKTKRQPSPRKSAGIEANPTQATPWEPPRLREFGTWEVNSLIKTVQNPNFAEWQFGGKKPSNGKMLVMQH